MAWAHYTSSSNCSAIPWKVFKFGGSLGLFHNCSENLRKANLRNQLSWTYVKYTQFLIAKQLQKISAKFEKSPQLAASVLSSSIVKRNKQAAETSQQIYDPDEFSTDLEGSCRNHFMSHGYFFDTPLNLRPTKQHNQQWYPRHINQMNRRVIRWANIAFGALLIVVGIAAYWTQRYFLIPWKGNQSSEKENFTTPRFIHQFSSRDLLIALQVSQRHAEQNIKHSMLSIDIFKDVGFGVMQF